MTDSRPRFRRLRLVVGSAGPVRGGIQEALLEEVGRLKQKDPLNPVVILVGSSVLRLHLQRYLAARLGGHANITFRLLTDLARELGTGSLLGRGRRRLPEFARELLLKEAIAARTHGTYFEHISNKEGFLEALGVTIRDLKDAAIDPVMLKAWSKGIRSGSKRSRVDEIAGRKMADLADLYEAYEDLLDDREFYDAEDLMRVAGGKAAGVGEENVLVYGFYDATWLQRTLIQEYVAFKSGAVFFPRDDITEDDSSDYGRLLLDWFRSWIPETKTLSRAPAPDLETRIFSCPGEGREVVEAVRWVVEQARDRSVPFGDLALLYRSPDPYSKLLTEVLEAAQVPCFLSEGRPPRETRPGRLLLLLLEVRRENYARRKVIELLSLTDQSSSASRWDRLSRQAGVVKGIDDWHVRLERLKTSLQGPDDSDRLRGVDGLKRGVDELHELLSGLPSQGSWREMAEVLIAIGRRYAGEDPSFARLEERLTVLGGLDDVATPVSLEAFTNLLTRLMDRPEHDPTRDGMFQRSGVFVGSVIDARLLTFHATCVMGMVEKVFPSAPRQDPILLDEERAQLNRLLGEERLPLAVRRLDEERLYFGIATSSPVESLMLSYPRLDAATARPRNPSPFLLRMASRLEGKRVDYDSLERLARVRRIGLAMLAPENRSNAIMSREFDMSVLQSSARDPEHRRKVATLLHAHPVLRRALEAEEARWGETRFTAHDGVILRPSLLDALRTLHSPAHGPVSASRIEDYAACPLAYFMKDVLRLRALEEPEDNDRIDPLRKGTVVHKILFETFTALREKSLLPITRSNLDAACTLLEETARRCFSEDEAAGLPGHALMWSIDRERIIDDLKRVLGKEADSEEDYIPRYFEVRYGGEPREGEGDDPVSTTEPVELETRPGQSVYLAGRIDRVEISADGTRARVTDYKTGRVRHKDGRLSGGTAIQLPLYMMAAEKVLGEEHPGIRAEEARYLHVSSKGKFRSVKWDGATLATRREDIETVVMTYINGVARGVFFAAPDPDSCRWCDYKLACGEGREARFERKRNDATAADFITMREEID